MRVLIVSDTHGRAEQLGSILQQNQPLNYLVHCGDVEGDEDYIRALAGCPVYMVKGNNDFFCDLPREEEFYLGNCKVFLTHGHYYGVSMDLEGIMDEGRARGADIVMFGHTHRPVVEEGKNIVALNPGSLSYPRQMGRKPSYIVMEIDEKNILHFAIKYVDK
ncbi:MAG: metallophosphoesterase [Lachnospiraceae bacterium]|nr:metallophosphoesterase [Lachnospiraceae bacterium]